MTTSLSVNIPIRLAPFRHCDVPPRPPQLAMLMLLAVPPEPVVVESRNPCVPSPCGPNSHCKAQGGTPVCSCLPSYVGRPPSCRPECTINAECPSNKACQNERCRDPCPGSCGQHADCSVVKHAPQCYCKPGFTGDPFSGCHPTPIALRTCLVFQGKA